MSERVLMWNDPEIIRYHLGTKGLQEYRMRKKATGGDVGLVEAREKADRWLKGCLPHA